MSERGYRVRIQYPTVSRYRYLGLDQNGWFTSSRDKARVFETQDSAEMALKHYLPGLPDSLVKQLAIELEPIPDFDPDWVTRPSSHLRDLLKFRQVDTQVFAEREAEVRAVLLDECPITDELAELLSQKLDTPKQYWLNLEHLYREGLKKGLKVL